MPWWKVIDTSGPRPKVDKKWLPGLIIVWIDSAAAARFVLQRYGLAAAPFVLLAAVLLMVADVKIRHWKERQQGGRTTGQRAGG